MHKHHHHHGAIDAPLSVKERAKISVQLGSTMLAVGLLALGWWQRTYTPELADVAQLIIAIAALIVAAPILWEAFWGLFTQDSHAHAAQLVALACLAAMVTREFEVAAFIAVIMNLGHFLEERSILGAQAAIDGLRQLHSGKAVVLVDGVETEIEAEAIREGDTLLVRPGDLIAADGDILEGASAVDQSSITGESVPEDLGAGDRVFAGTVNMTGVIKVGVTEIGSHTTLGRVVELLQEAEQSKPPVLKLIDRYAGYYVPFLVTIAAVVLFINTRPPDTLSGDDVAFNAGAISRAVSILVVGCPGAFILAGPTAMIAALAAASRLGILIKNTQFMESLADADTVVLDKTGTVTLGHLELVGVVPQGGAEAKDVLDQAVACAAGSRHPVSRAIVEAVYGGPVPFDLDAANRIDEVAGKGIRRGHNGDTWLLGRREWLLEQGLNVPENPAHAGPIVWLGRQSAGSSGGAAAACFLFADVARPEAKEALSELRGLGFGRSVLLTGDRREVAEHIGQSLQMDEIIAEVLPEQKLDAIRAEREAGRTVMMVGDGVNDALALSSGDVGVALGAVASDVALQSADVALMKNDLRRLPTTVRLARRTRRVINQNVLIAAMAGVVGIWLAAIGVVNVWLAAPLHVVGEIAVIFNSGRLLGFGRDKDL
jgi:Cd2+/Zn2+-exporting ATPase